MMPTQEQLTTIRASVQIAQKRLQRLEALGSVNALTQAQKHELAMTKELIARGKRLLKEKL